jgi:exodeoxyribonuclease VII large subunit
MPTGPAPQEPRTAPPARSTDTSAENPWPLRVLTLKLQGYLDKLTTVWVEAQIVEAKRRPGMTTVYATLRDPDTDMSMTAVVDAGMLDRLGPQATAGARVVVLVQVQFQARRGTLTLAVRQMRLVGVGELLARIEALKTVLRAEGLFDRSRKRPLPFLPRTVGLVCGRASAAERDVVENARARWPAVQFRILEVAVQGQTAAADVSEAVRVLDADASVDVIVVARGGGSLEDLLPFSNESLLRAVAACRTPVVSAIGHEVDSPLLDLVADARASTPTDAARLVVPDVAAELAGLAQARQRARRCVADRVATEARLIADLRARPVLADRRSWLEGLREAIVENRRRTRDLVHRRVVAERTAMLHQRAHLRALSPQATLDRGYAIARTADGEVVRHADAVPAGADLHLNLARGTLQVQTVGRTT